MKSWMPTAALFALALVTFAAAHAQTLPTTLDSLHEQFPNEKLHVHFDKPAYSTGETVWFKAYLFSNNIPSSISTNFYAELLDGTGKLLEKKVYPVYEASAAGSFDLPAKLKGKGVFIRAYTTWMLNFDTAFLFSRYLPLSQGEQGPAPASSTTLRFFPEGGDWVATLPSVVAFKATGEDGRPRTVSGVIKNDKGQLVTDFHTVHDGMGQVSLVPQAGAVYTAEWKDESGGLHITPLPATKSEGVILEAANRDSAVAFSIRRTEGAGPSFHRVHVVATMHQQTVYRASANLATKTAAGGTIPYEALATGPLLVTLFDEAWKPLAERLVFVDRGDYRFPAQVTFATKNLGKRGRNVVEVEVPDTLRANLSLAITDAQLGTGGSNDIVSRLLLTADLRGYVHNPGYYFSSTADSVREHRDLLLRTHGWRRYNWEALAAGVLPKVRFPAERYLTLRGNIYGLRPGQLGPGEQLNVIMEGKDSSSRLVMIPIQKDGTFALGGLIFFDTVKVFYQLNGTSKIARNALVEFARQAYPAHLKPGIDAAALVQARLATLPARAQFFAQKAEEVQSGLQKIKVLQGVTVRTRARSREQELDNRYANGLFRGGNGRSFNLLDDPAANSYQDALQYLQGRVAGLQISNYGGTYTLRRRQAEPALFLDEMPVDASMLTSIPVSNIAYIKVIDPPFMGAPFGGSGGAIAVYTRKGGEEPASSTSPGLARGSLAGYAPLKEFYSPDYAYSTPLHELEDVRSTLYWNPYLLTDKTTRKVRIEFYNNDVSGALRVVLEGVNEEGRLTRVEQVVQ